MLPGAWFEYYFQASQEWEKEPNKAVNSVCASDQQEMREKSGLNAKNSLTAEQPNCYKLCPFFGLATKCSVLVIISQSATFRVVVSQALPKNENYGN